MLRKITGARGFVVAAVAAAAAAPTLVSHAQQPPAPTPQEDILEELETAAERQATRDLERLGPARTREKAERDLRTAQTDALVAGSDAKADHPAILRLREALRYYARAHGLTSNLDELIGELEMIGGLNESVSQDPTLAVTRDEKDQEAETIKRWGKSYRSFWYGLYRLRKFKAAPATPAPTPTPTSRAEGSGLSKGTKIAIGAGAGAAALLAVAAGGGGGSSGRTAATPTPAPALTPFNPAGVYDVTLTVASDPAGNAARIGMEPNLWLNVSVTGATMTYTCPPGSHINPGGGPVDLTTGAFNAAGSGAFAGRSGVQFQFPGTFTREGAITGEYRVGTGGELGGTTTYAVAGRIRR